MTRALAIALSLFTTAAAAGEPWSTSERVLGTAALAALAIDWGQTRYIAKNPQSFHETNPILGRHPSVGRVDAYFAGAIIGTALLADALPSKWRGPFLAGVVVVELHYVNRNAALGIRVSF
jgi:hypothetical protein